MTSGPPDPPPDPVAEPLATDPGPLGILPRVRRRQIQVEQRLGRTGPLLVSQLVAAWNTVIGGDLRADRFAVEWRAAGINRPGVIAQFAWPRLRTRVALGIDPPLAHAVVDRLLGYRRTPAEAHLQVSPVEWGVLAFLMAYGLDQLESAPGPLGPWDLTIDRVGPDPYLLTDLGRVVTWRWRVQVGDQTGTARLWMPESLLRGWLAAGGVDPRFRSGLPLGGAGPDSPRTWSRFAGLTSEFHVEIGTTTCRPGAADNWLGPGRLLLFDQDPWTGTLANPVGKAILTQTVATTQVEWLARVEPGSGGDRLTLISGPHLRPTLRSPPMADPSPRDADSPPPVGPPTSTVGGTVDVGLLTVTLTVELGRVSLPLARLAELQPGDVIELGRPSRQPVDLTSNGRLVARGELVQVDTELGVRIVQVCL